MEGVKKWIKSKKGQQTIIIIAFLIVPITLLILFTYFPFTEMLRFSFYKMKYATPIEKRQFVGFDNYIKVFEREDCFKALKLCGFYIAGAMLQLAIALYLATVLSFKTKGGNMFKGVMFFPFLISGIAIGYIFKFFYTREFVFDTVLQWCGFQLDQLPFWLRDQKVNNWALAASSVWRYFGQNMVLFIGAIMSVDSEMYEAAELDGANKVQQFFHIILPSIKTIVTLNIILSITGSLSAFDPPYVITRGGNGTGTYFVIMSDIAHTDQKVGLACAMAVVLFMIIFIATLLQKAGLQYLFRNSNADDETYSLKKKRIKEHRQKWLSTKMTALKGGKDR